MADKPWFAASSMSREGVKLPSEAVEWVCKSTMTRNLTTYCQSIKEIYPGCRGFFKTKRVLGLSHGFSLKFLAK
jgi:hypothetical protein